MSSDSMRVLEEASDKEMDYSDRARPSERDPGPQMQQLPSQETHLAAVVGDEHPPTMQLQCGVSGEIAPGGLWQTEFLVLEAHTHRLSDELPLDYRATYTSMF
ncbi:hypothetical protein B0H13DRAFT_1894477 [Mycena leptocephala]|nr:hypothetical protein B0H13DRAFT_1894477 [Mycena leptocephala]